MPGLVLRPNALSGLWARVRRSAMGYGVLATAIRVGSNVVLLPIILKALAPPELALWYVFLALGGIANLADFGFGHVIGRVYSFLWAGAEDFQSEGLGPPPQTREPNRAGIRSFHGAARLTYLRISLAAIVLLLSVGTLILLRPIAATSNVTGGWICWAAFILAVAYTLGTSYWQLACQGINRVRDLQAAHVMSGLTYVLSAGLLLVLGWGLFAMVIATALRAVVARAMCRHVFLAEVPPTPGQPVMDVTSVLKRIWPNAWKFGMVALGGYLTLQASVLICSHFLGSEATASFGLTTQLGGFIAAFSGLWLTVKWPELTIMRTQGRLQEMGILFARRLALVMATFIALAIVLVLGGNAALEWKGAQTKVLPTAYLIAYLLCLFQQHFYIQFATLTYTENVVAFFKLSIFSGVATVLLSAWLVPRFGLWGLILAPALVTVTSVSWYVILRGFRVQPLNLRQFTRAALLGHL